MHIAVATEARFTQGPDGIVRSDTGGGDYTFWRRYLDAFEGVLVVARVVETSHARGLPVVGDGVDVYPLKNYLGLRGWGRQFFANRAKIRAITYRLDTAFLARVPGAVGSMMISALREKNRPFGLEVVGDPAAVFRSGIVPGPFAGLLGKFAAYQMRKQCSSARVISYVTESQLQEIYPAFGADFSTHYSSVDLPEIAFVESPPSLRETRPVLVAVGGMSQRYKGHDVLLRAIASLPAEGAACNLRLVGDGRLRGELERLVEETCSRDRVTFVGQVSSGAGVRAELDLADIFVLPSRTEGLPRALIEAMARGLPCIASDVGGVSELLKDEDMAPADDPVALASLIAAVVANPSRRSEMARRNLETARDYSSAKLGDRRRDFYRRLRLVSADQAVR